MEREDMGAPPGLKRFERQMLPHLPVAYSLARWLVDNLSDADDVVQEAYLRAFRSFDRMTGDDPLAWLLTIVRHTAYTWMRDHKRSYNVVPFDELAHSPALDPDMVVGRLQPDQLSMMRSRRDLVRDAIADLPVAFREVIVLRELHDLSYKEIARIIESPVGTVMSRLARGRRLLREALVARSGEVSKGEL
jgi:RNA polymerase sigma-70 factor (ECF subfamily)